MGKKYLDTKDGTLESSILGVWKDAAEMQEQGHDGRTKSYKEHRAKLEAARARREEKKLKEGSKEEYQKFFNAAMKKFGIDSPADLKSDEEKKKFFDYVDKNYTGEKDEEVQKLRNELFGLDEGKMSQIDQMMKDGKSAEEIAKELKLKVKDVKKIMGESYEIGTDEYRDHTLDITPGQHLTWGSANAYKQASMKEALAKVWGLDEKKLDKSEESDIIAPVKGKKSMTGGDIAKVEVDPEKKEGK